VAHLGDSPRALRFWCLAASIAPDLDGLGLFFGRDAYFRYHHVICHNFLFVVGLVLLAGRWLEWRPWALTRVLACGLLHLLGDYWGSGQGWALYLFEPFSHQTVLNPRAWDFNGWQSQLVFWLAVAVAFFIAARHSRTPFECLIPGMDRTLADFAAIGYRARCACGRRAFARCHDCRAPLCHADGVHPGWFRLLCPACARGAKR
jgi:membrane-bound metal-dependent hydrolase YbcI (DUF457 family)